MPLDDQTVANALGKPPPLGEILDGTARAFKRFVVLTDQQANVLALWVAHTHAFEAAECTPYIQITSAEKRSGKTRVLEVAQWLVAKPWKTGRVTAAVLTRKIANECPTLLLDEFDAAFRSGDEYAQTLRSILNCGYLRGGTTSVCIGQSTNITYRDLEVFSPKAFAGIGELPDTIADRCIRIELKRKRRDEGCERFRPREHRASLIQLHEAFAGWASDDVVKELAAAWPALPDELDDRAQDVWEPLLAIADLAGGDWPSQARRAAIQRSHENGQDDHSSATGLLAGAHAAFEHLESDRIATRELAVFLANHDEALFGHLSNNGEMAKGASQWIAKRLKPFEIRSATIRTADNNTPKGYKLEAFRDAFARYLPAETPHPPHPPPDKGFSSSRDRHNDPPVADPKIGNDRVRPDNVADVAPPSPPFEGNGHDALSGDDIEALAERARKAIADYQHGEL